MNFRYRINTIPATASHLFFLLTVVLMLAPGALTQNAPSSDAFYGAGPGEPITMRFRQLEHVDGRTVLTGDVEIDARDYILRADKIVYDEQTGQTEATGDVSLNGGPSQLHMNASHALYNINTQLGIFYDVAGSVGAQRRKGQLSLSADVPFRFWGKEVEKAVGERYIVRHGEVTSCQEVKPLWRFQAASVEVVAGEDAIMRHAAFYLHGAPLFYFPYVSAPTSARTRKSGFLLPNVGNSSSKGFILGEGFYWAINRSMDATISGEYFSKRGWSQRGELRMRPAQEAEINVNYFGVLDRGVTVTTNDVKHLQDQTGQEITISARNNFGQGVRGVATLDYLSSFLFRAAFSESYTQAIDSESKSTAFLTKHAAAYTLDLFAERYQNFQSVTKGDQILVLHAPSFQASSVEQRLGRTPFKWSFSAAAEGLSRREPSFVTDSLYGRYDLHPALSLPVQLGDWLLRADVSLRDTYYSQTMSEPVGAQTGQPIDQGRNRRTVDGGIELRPPALERIFATPVHGRKLKHVIEPRISYHATGGVDHFLNYIRVDENDVLSNSSELEVGLTQRLYAKPLRPIRDPLCDRLEADGAPLGEASSTQPGELLPGSTAEPLHCQSDSSAREVLSWEVKQRYYFNRNFGGSLIDGHRNVLASTADFTAIAFLLGPRRLSPVVSRLRYAPTSNADLDWELDYDPIQGRINANTVTMNVRHGEFFLGGSHAFLRAAGEITTGSTIYGSTTKAPNVFDQFRMLIGYGHPGKLGLSAGGSVGYDVDRLYRQYTAAQASYNWDCCGLSFEYRIFSLGSIRSNEHQYRFTFSLLNLGTLGNMRRKERLY